MKLTGNKKGQTLTEYIIIVAIIAIAAIAVVGAFSDRIREMFTGATEELGGEAAAESGTSSTEWLQSMGSD